MEAEAVKNTIAKVYCKACQRYFVSPSLFDAHRIGNYGEPIYKASSTDKSQKVVGHQKPTRRCMSLEEMHAAGMATEKKNVRIILEGKTTYEEHDVWFSPEDRAKVRAAFGRGTE
jgi:hypothetical protein